MRGVTLATVETYHHSYRRRDRHDEYQREVLAFRLGAEEYAVDILRIRELLKLRPITDVPRAPPFVLGIMSVRGQIVPIVDLRMRLRMALSPPSRESRIVMVTRGEDLFGLLVDGVRQVVRLRDDDVEATPRTLGAHDAEYLAGIARPRADGARMLILLNLDAVLAFQVGVAAVPPPAGAPR